MQMIYGDLAEVAIEWSMCCRCMASESRMPPDAWLQTLYHVCKNAETLEEVCRAGTANYCCSE